MTENVHKKQDDNSLKEPQESSALYGGVIGGVLGLIIIVMIILGILFFMRKKGSIYNHVLGHIGIN
jgi:hypothetical protein